ncbi:PREDICTED: uncharacterized endoplasmic reticulum membrane protein C16E8.02-like [Camelina sativa]|uniref:Uncharacterized endoplasmic reticulum membrane protein C16E8.02-like n=1 Tax=Camelina sativa TaxID=90675 RepID=A0ABM0TM77_CAMSA|nr:PREDICTED: uncharacterized endoplasmic reticulum membrane protein C16E8.02-like [Camelina sativa]
MRKRIGLLDLEKHFAFYGAYHSNPINIIIHTLFVWPNVFATLLFLYSSTPPALDHSQLGFLKSLTFDGVLRLDIGFTLTVIYSVFYICLDKKSGVLAALLCFSCWIGSSFLAARLGHSLTLKVGIASQLLCWIGQFLGHGLFEKRAPALLDNLVQAFLMGPFFVLLEVLQSVFGYEPYSGFKARVDSKIKSEIKEWREKKQKKIT